MIYPTISEYIESIMSAEDNFDKLNMLRPVLDGDGHPVMSSGNFAVVFKMQDEKTEKLYAVKCFIKDQEGRDGNYRKISDELANVQSSYLCEIEYLPKELFVDTANGSETEYPVLKMDWVEGVPLDKYLQAHLNNKYDLAMLCYQFCRMAAWLLTQPFAHGDLKPDNILVKQDGTLKLVDYDGMYVPAMQGDKAHEMGSPDYRHPLRTEDDFNEYIDDFSLASIALSLKAICLDSSLFDKYGSSDYLLFTASDYLNLSHSGVVQALQSLMTDAEFNRLYGMFLWGHSQKNLSAVSFRLFNLQRPEKSIHVVEEFSTKVSDEDWKEAVTDKYGVKYSKDGKRLLKCPHSCRSYVVKDGTKVICDYAFSGCSSLSSVTIPSSVTSIGNIAFSGCSSLSSVTIPSSVTSIGNSAFIWCPSLSSVTIPSTVTSIGDCAFSGCSSLSSVIIPSSVVSIGDSAFSGCSSLSSVIIPSSVMSIGNGAFSGCSSLSGVIIPSSVMSIGNGAFSGCSSLSRVTIPSSVTSIGNGAFSGCSSLSSVTIPSSVTSIGNGVFVRCSIRHFQCLSDNFVFDGKALYDKKMETLISLIEIGVESFQIPSTVTSISHNAFDGCTSLLSVTIPSSVTSIGNYAFNECSSLSSVTIPSSVISIGDSAFSGCSSLLSVTIPSSVTSIRNYAFNECSSLSSVTISSSVTSIGLGVFEGCTSLSIVIIPSSVTSIGDYAFGWCTSLSIVTIPSSVTSIGYYAFWWCKSLLRVIIPNGTSSKFEKLLPSSLKAKLVEQ